jgi:hypothetical protein
MKKQNEIWLVEARYKNGAYQPFCQSVGCKSKHHAQELAKDKSAELKLPCRVALYRRVK